MFNLPQPDGHILEISPLLHRFMRILAAGPEGTLLGAGLALDSMQRPYVSGITPFSSIVDRSPSANPIRVDDSQMVILEAIMRPHPVPPQRPVDEMQAILAGQIFGA